MKKLIIIIIIFTLYYSITAQQLSGIDPAYEGFDVRQSALGGAGIAIKADTPSATIYNPASVYYLDSDLSLQFTNSTFWDLVSYNFAGISRKLANGSVMTLSVDFSGDELMTEWEVLLGWCLRANSFLPQTSFTEKLIAGTDIRVLGSSFGGDESGAYIDENGLNHQVTGNSWGFAVDWGVQYEISNQHRVALSNRNLLNTIFWDSTNEIGTAMGEYTEGRPLSLVAGYCYQRQNSLLCIDYNRSLYSDRESFLHTGIELAFWDSQIKLRGGLCQQLYSLKALHYNLGCGFSIPLMKKKLQCDLAYRIFPQWQGSNCLHTGINLSF